MEREISPPRQLPTPGSHSCTEETAHGQLEAREKYRFKQCAGNGDGKDALCVELGNKWSSRCPRRSCLSGNYCPSSESPPAPEQAGIQQPRNGFSICPEQWRAPGDGSDHTSQPKASKGSANPQPGSRKLILKVLPGEAAPWAAWPGLRGQSWAVEGDRRPFQGGSNPNPSQIHRHGRAGMC